MRRGLGVLVVVLAAIGTVALTVMPRKAPPAYVAQPVDLRVTPTVKPTYGPLVGPVRALWVGDSYVHGAGAATPAESYPELVARDLGWASLATDAQGGTGFVNDGQNGKPETVSYSTLQARLAGTVAAHPKADVVLIDAGRNDGGNPVEQVTTAARLYLASIVKAYPNARLVLVVPAFVNRPVDAASVALRKTYLRFAAGRAGTVVVNTQGWFKDPAADVAADGVHPNNEGHRIYATEFEAVLRKV